MRCCVVNKNFHPSTMFLICLNTRNRSKNVISSSFGFEATTQLDLIIIMMKAIVVLVLFVATVYAQGGGEGGYHHHHHEEEYIDYQAKPEYHYSYGVHDPKKHDIHNQWEHRDGHKTKGMYSLVQPDGRKRIVEYEADKHGINYKVKFEGHAHHPEHYKIYKEEHHQEEGGHGHGHVRVEHHGNYGGYEAEEHHEEKHYGGGGEGGGESHSYHHY